MAPSHKIPSSTAAALNIGTSAYDITVVSANRFLRRFTGDVTKAAAAAKVTVSYYEDGFGEGPSLILELGNGGTSDVTYTITHNQYSPQGPKSYKQGLPGKADVMITGCYPRITR